jgi:hypothetical protein
MKSVLELFEQVLSQRTDEMYCTCPCKVVGVNGNFVDVMAYINDEDPDIVLYHVPIKREESQRAYISLGIAVGDYGTLTFFDRDTNDYIESADTDFNGNEEQHSINFRCFSLGFVPNPSAYVYPTNADIEIGLKDGSCKINLTSGNVTISGGNINITGGSVNISGNTTIDGKVFLEHTHSNGNQGAATGTVL